MNKEDLLKIFKNKNNRYLSGTVICERMFASLSSSREKEESEDKKAVMTDGEPMVVKEVYPKVRGVIVTADGGGNSAVRSAISEAVTASLDVPAHRICIFKKEVK